MYLLFDPEEKEPYYCISLRIGGVAREEWVTGYVRSENNAADPLTKTNLSGERRDRLVGHYLYEM